MTERQIPDKESKEFFEDIKERIPKIMESFPEEDKVRRTVVVPRVFDDALYRSIAPDLLRFYGKKIDYSDLLVGFAMMGLATVTSEQLIEKLANDVDILEAFDEARQKKGDE
jgi:hypothetical protein